MQIYVVSYDISGDRARDRVSKILLTYGERVQESVFEITIRRPRELLYLCERIKDELGDEGNVRFYRLCHPCRQHSQKLNGEPVADFSAVVIV